jgi:phosphoglycerate-specific signal transduction histidine kinase
MRWGGAREEADCIDSMVTVDGQTNYLASSRNVSETVKDGWTLTTISRKLSTGDGHRVPLQQVFINLVMNGIEGMGTVTLRPRDLVIRSRSGGIDQVLVAARDAGVAPSHVVLGPMCQFTLSSFLEPAL